MPIISTDHGEGMSAISPNRSMVTGSNFYLAGVLACHVEELDNASMECLGALWAATTNFRLTGTFSESTESLHLTSFTFAISTATLLKAVITKTIFSGPAPLSVNFNTVSLAGTYTTQNTDTSALRMLQITTTGIQVKVEEEKSKDKEVTASCGSSRIPCC